MMVSYGHPPVNIILNIIQVVIMFILQLHVPGTEANWSTYHKLSRRNETKSIVTYSITQSWSGTEWVNQTDFTYTYSDNHSGSDQDSTRMEWCSMVKLLKIYLPL
jgi:hypothetical protein